MGVNIENMAIIEQIFVDFAKKIEGSVWPANFLGVMQKSLPIILGIIFMTGNFYIVATPIGNLQDFSPRAQDILQNVDLILAEDTRHSRKLLDFYGINSKLKSLHEHNEEQSIEKIIQELTTKDIALISDAGTPLISDPGFKLVRSLKERGFSVIPIPGPSALIAALSAAGLSTARFCFEGFVPKTKKAREDFFKSLLNEYRTMVFYESPKRVLKTLGAMQDIFGGNRLCSIARELSKKHENIVTDTLAGIYKIFADGNEPLRGEFVIMLEGRVEKATDDEELNRVLQILLKELTTSKAVKLASKIAKVNKNTVYEKALSIKK